MLSTRSKVAASGFVMMAATWVPSASAAQIYSPSATPTSGIAVQDHIVTMVMVADNVITLAEYFSKVEPAAKQSGRPMNLVVDPSAVSRGYFMAFDSDKAAERYLTSTDMVSPSTGSFSMPDDLALSGIQARTAEAPMQTVSACGLIRMVNLYDNASCGGSYLGMIYSNWSGCGG